MNIEQQIIENFEQSLMKSNGFMNGRIVEFQHIKTNCNFEKDNMLKIANQNHKKLKSKSNYFAGVFFIHNMKDRQTTRLIVTNRFSIQTDFNMLLLRTKDIEQNTLQYLSMLYDKSQSTVDYKACLIKRLIAMKKEIATMESCTAGMIATTITNYEGASNILKGSLITYSNEAKIQFGVSKHTIDTAGVYSYETAIEMAKQTQGIFNSTYGIGVTGSLGNIDTNNADSIMGHIYFSIFDNGKNLSKNGRIIQYDNSINRKDMKLITTDICLLELLCSITD